MKLLQRFVLYYLRFFARQVLKRYQLKIIGITGSVGKSSTRNAIYSVLKDYFRVKMIEKGNSETGIPLGILGLDPGNYQALDWLKNLLLAPFKTSFIKDYQYLVIEMGIDSPFWPKNMDYLLTIVQPDISVVLNAYPVHTMQFDCLINKEITGEKRREFLVRRIAKEKVKIISLARPEMAIYNQANDYINEQVEKIRLSQKNIRFISFGGEDSNIRLLDYQLEKSGTKFSFYLKEKSQRLDLNISGYLLPKAYQEVFSAAILVGKVLGLENQQIIEGLKKNFYLPAGRGSIFDGISSSTIIDSSYNASKASMLAYLDLVWQLAKKEKLPLILVLGEMRELGLEAELEHQEVAEKIIQIKPKEVFLIGEEMKKYVYPKLKDAEIKTQVFENSIKIGSYLKENLKERSILLFKGSQNTIFLEEAVKLILKNQDDEKRLCRQSQFWLKKKSYLFD